MKRILLAVCLIVCLVLLFRVDDVAAQTRSPLKLKLDHIVEILANGKVARFCVHFASDTRSRRTGLMFQKKLAEHAGMMFDFNASQPVHMWMQNTVLPLDMIFITDDFRVLRIEQDTTPFSLEIISSGAPARYVLEVNAGISNKWKIEPGDNIRFFKGKC